MSGCADGVPSAADSSAAIFCDRVGRNIDAWSRCGPFLSEQEALKALLPTVGGYENSPTGHVASYSSGKVSLPEVAGTADLRKFVNGSDAAFLEHPESILLSAEDYAAQESALGPLVFIRTRCWVAVRRIGGSLIGISWIVACSRLLPFQMYESSRVSFFVTKKMAGSA